jgi:hypothetical protein
MAFAYRRYYPEGGFGDFIGSFDTERDAVNAVTGWLMNEGEGTGDVVDTKTGLSLTYVRRFQSDNVELYDGVRK